MSRATWVSVLVLVLTSTAPAGEIRPAIERFATARTAEVPDFQRHVVPLLTRLGCNGRACHGSFQGQGGFRLSLFGYDFEADHRSLTRGEAGAPGRADVATPADSLLLDKPTLRVSHRGGRRLEKDQWGYNLLLRWIEGGAHKANTAHKLDRLVVTPSEIVFARPGETVSIRVTAQWSDGVREDVTCLSRFQTNDDAITEVADALVTARGKGDTHVVVYYDNGVTAVPVLIPATDRIGEQYPKVAASTRIDELVNAKLRDLGIVPSEVCGDAEFLRRASLDLTGTLPLPQEVERFLADRSADKRSRKIDELLESPGHAALWATRLGDYTGNRRFGQGEGPIGQKLAVQWYSWLYRRVVDNMPYDKLVEGIVLATGRAEGQGYEEYSAEMSSYFREKDPADFARRPTLPHYWSRRNVTKPEDRVLAFAHTFLGVRLQCAQCHKHPHDRWTQDDFRQLTAFFTPLRFGVSQQSREVYLRLAASAGVKPQAPQGTPVTQELLTLAEEGKTIPWREVYVEKSPGGRMSLLGDAVDVAGGEDPRVAVMRWLREKDNPYFARAFVNRVWAGYFHAGLVDPPDDFSRANPPSNEPLLDYLSRDFVKHGYDMRRLHRLIVNSDTYQRSMAPNDTNRGDARNFSRAIPRRVPAEVVYDMLVQATAADADQETVRSNLDRRAVGHLATGLSGTYAMQVFGKPDRMDNCDCERSNRPSLLQSIFLQNDPLVQDRLSESGWLKEIAAQKTPDESALIRQAYLRTLSRPPGAAESARAARHLRESESLVEGMRDLLWALMNSREFILNH